MAILPEHSALPYFDEDYDPSPDTGDSVKPTYPPPIYPETKAKGTPPPKRRFSNPFGKIEDYRSKRFVYNYPHRIDEQIAMPSDGQIAVPKRSTTISFAARSANVIESPGNPNVRGDLRDSSRFLPLSATLRPKPSSPPVPRDDTWLPPNRKIYRSTLPGKSVDDSENVQDNRTVYSLTSTILNLSSDSLNTLVSEQEVREFLTMEEDPIPSLHRSLSVPSKISGAPSDCLDPHLKSKTAPKPILLKDFCELIGVCHSLARATIREVQCYKVKKGVGHRFLLLLCYRPSRSAIWIRVDRKRRGNLAKLALHLGRVKAHDTVKFAVLKTDLFNDKIDECENKLTFKDKYPSLGAFRLVLDIICEELVEYAFWPENCWFLCSVLQEQLQIDSDGTYAYGSEVRPDLGSAIRLRIDARIARIYHKPEPLPNTDELLYLVTKEPWLSRTRMASHFKVAVGHAKAYPTFPLLDSESLTLGTIEKLVRLAASLQTPEFLERLPLAARCVVLARSLAVYRHLYHRKLLDGHTLFHSSILTYADLLRRSGREHEELFCYEEALGVERDQYERNPSENVSRFLGSLAQHADRLLSAGLIGGACAIRKEIVAVSDEYLATSPPEATYSELAGCRCDYIDCLKTAHRFEDACIEAREVVKMAQVLHKSKPWKFGSELAHRLREYADHLTSLSRLDEACGVLREAVDLQRVAYENEQDTLESLVSFLDHYKDAVSRAGVRNELLDVHRETFRRDPQSSWRTMVAALAAHATYLSDLGREGESFDVEHELIGVYRRLHEMDPNTHYDRFFGAVSGYSDRLASANRVPEACEAILEIVDLHKQLYSRDRHQHHMRLAGVSEVYFYRLKDLNRFQDAGNVAMGCVEMYHGLWQENHSEYRKILMNTISKYAFDLNAAGYEVKKRRILVEVHKDLYESDPNMKNAQDLAERLASFARSLGEVLRWQDACDVALEMVKLLQDHPFDPRSPEHVRRTQQLHACALHVAKARRFAEALKASELAFRSAKAVEEDRCPRDWVEQWRPKITNTYEHLTRINRIKKHSLQVLEAQNVGLTYREPSPMKNQAHPRRIVIGLSLGIVLAAIAFASLWAGNITRHRIQTSSILLAGRQGGGAA